MIESLIHKVMLSGEALVVQCDSCILLDLSAEHKCNVGRGGGFGLKWPMLIYDMI